MTAQQLIPKGRGPVWQLPVSLGVSLRPFFSLLPFPLHFPTASSSLPGSGGLRAAGLPSILSPVSTAISHYLQQSHPGRAGRKPACDSPVFPLHPLPSPETKAKQPVNRSAVSLGSLTPISHSHYFRGSASPPQAVLGSAASPRPGLSLPPGLSARRQAPRAEAVPATQPAGPLILAEISPAWSGRLAVCAKDRVGQCSGLPHYRGGWGSD